MHVRSFLVALVLLAVQVPAQAAFARLGILGDSLSDTGRLFNAMNDATAGFLALPDEPYLPGRFSNGPVWAEYYAAAHPEVEVGNLAMGGAMSGTINGIDNAGDFDFAGIPLIGGLLQSVATGLDDQLPRVPNVAGTNTAFVLWIGANDLNHAINLGFDTHQDIVATSLANVSNAIDMLLGLGASQVFVGNVPDLGVTPDGMAGGRSADLTAATLDFNGGLAAIAATAGSQVRVVDVYSAFNALLANAAAAGFGDTTTPCVDGLFDDSACADPANHVFWDGVHPTTGVHALVADVFAQAFAAPVPLPAGALLLAPALGLLAARRRTTPGPA